MLITKAMLEDIFDVMDQHKEGKESWQGKGLLVSDLYAAMRGHLYQIYYLKSKRVWQIPGDQCILMKALKALGFNVYLDPTTKQTVYRIEHVEEGN